MSGYIMDLRKIVGHRPLLQVGAGIIVEDPQGRVLLQLRADNHCWGYCGGSMELDEQAEDTAKRELFEETGLIAEKLELFGVFSGPEYHYIYPNGDEVSNVDIVFLCRSYSGTLKCQEEEVEDLQFFAADALPENLSPPIRKPLMQWAKQKLGQCLGSSERCVDMIGKTVTVTIDRPLGSFHPKHPDIYYPINYGFIEGIMAPDGEEQDAYILGVDVPLQTFTGSLIAVIHRHDDVEDKWVVAPEGVVFTQEGIAARTYFQEQYFDSEIIM